MPAKTYAQHCLCLVSAKPEQREALEKIFAKVHYAFPDPNTDYIYESPPLESCEAVLEDIDTVFGVNCPPWLTDLKQTPKLTWWMTASAGFDHLLQKPFFSKASLGNEIPFVFTTNSGTHAGAIPPWNISYTVQLLTNAKRFWQLQLLEQRWEKPPGMDSFHEMQGLTFGICGYGAIGRETARLAKAFGCKVIAANTKGDRKPDPAAPIVCPGLGDPEGSIPEEMYSTADKASFYKFLAKTDVLVLSLPVNASTKGLISKEALKTMKKSSYVINIGRGGLVDTDAIIDALENEDIAGAALDVTDPEPLPQGHRLWTTKNAIITPHVSGWTEKYIPRSVHILCENAKLLRTGKEPVNKASFTPQ